jgi:catechol 2,3-dioxygenase-like lactoylglutathione lyase family enzyme
MRFSHIGIVARDANRLAEFYKKVFGCKELRSPRTISGEKVSRGNGLPDSRIYSIWLSLPGVEIPFLEIHQYDVTKNRAVPYVNEPGYGHISFAVKDIRSKSAEIVDAGGQKLGEITNLGSADNPVLAVYMRDLEGNVIEIEER